MQPEYFGMFGLIDIGSHTVMMPRLLAHEFGHLLGSDHDGDQVGAAGHKKYSIYKHLQRVPCPGGKFLMSPSVGLLFTFMHLNGLHCIYLSFMK